MSTHVSGTPLNPHFQSPGSEFLTRAPDFNANRLPLPSLTVLEHHQPAYGGFGLPVRKTGGGGLGPEAPPDVQKSGTVNRPMGSWDVPSLVVQLRKTETSSGQTAFRQLEDRVTQNVDRLWDQKGPLTYQSLLELKPHNVALATSYITAAATQSPMATHSLVIDDKMGRPEHFFGLNKLAAKDLNETFFPTAVEAMLNRYNFKPSKIEPSVFDIPGELNDQIGRFPADPEAQKRLIDWVYEMVSKVRR